MLKKHGIRCVVCLFVFGGVVGAEEAKISADELIEKYIKAIGGKEKLEKVTSRRMTGKAVFGPGIESATTYESKRPNKVRIEFSFQGMTGTQAFDGQTGWSIMPFGGKTDPEKMSADQLKEVEDEADMDGPLVDYKKKGHQIEVVGKEDLEGSPAYKLKLTKKNGDVEHYFLDAEKYLPLKVSGKHKFQGTEMEMETILGDYKSVDGLMLAHSIQNRAAQSGPGMSFVVDKVEHNVSLSDDRFSMPAPAAKSETPPEKKDTPPSKP
jgi:hypothetical protein